MTRNTLPVHLWFIAFIVGIGPGCPGGAGGGADTSTETDDEVGPAIGACPDLAPLPPSQPVPSYNNISDTEVLQWPMSECPIGDDQPAADELGVQIIRPAQEPDGDWPVGVGSFPLIVFEHGNSHFSDNYPELMMMLATHGYVVANITSDDDATEVSRSAHIYCVTRRLFTDLDWSGADRMSVQS